MKIKSELNFLYEIKKIACSLRLVIKNTKTYERSDSVIVNKEFKKHITRKFYEENKDFYIKSFNLIILDLKEYLNIEYINKDSKILNKKLIEYSNQLFTYFDEYTDIEKLKEVLYLVNTLQKNYNNCLLLNRKNYFSIYTAK